MKLASYLKLKEINQKDFGKKIGVRQSTVCRYILGRIPTKSIISKIYYATNGEVTPNDFYNIDKLVVSLLKPQENPKKTPKKPHIVKQAEHYSVCSEANR